MLHITLECLSLKAALQHYLAVLACKNAHFASPWLEVLFGDKYNILRSGNQCDFLTAVLKLNTKSVDKES